MVLSDALCLNSSLLRAGINTFKSWTEQQKKGSGKKVMALSSLSKARHLKHGLPFFVVEAGQYRISFEQRKNMRIIVFAGTHKQYERWYKEQ